MATGDYASPLLAEAVGGSRFAETAKVLPVLFVVCNIAGLWGIYMWFHCMRLWRIPEKHEQAVWQVAVFNSITVMLLMNYVQCILVHPGSIPSKYEDPSWDFVPQDGKRSEDGQLQETKKSGERRHCKWCGKFKPDRCHHCRVCRMCILKMDHHCPWIYNCVGFRNHKYFFLLLVYSAAACHFITWTMVESVKVSIDSTVPFADMFAVLFGETLAAFLGILVTVFLCFHIWLMLRGMTTIEFCEKGKGRSPYDRGLAGNIRTVLGDNPMLWLLPLSLPPGRGLHYLGEDEPEPETAVPIRDLEGSRGSHKRGSSQKTQGREPRHPACGGTPQEDAFISGSESNSITEAAERKHGYGAVDSDSH